MPSSYFYLLLGFGNFIYPTNEAYKAIINPVSSRVVIDSLVNLDSRGSYVKNGLDPKFYYWSIKSTPVGSFVKKIGLKGSSTDKVSFVPDKTGIYEIELIVGDESHISPPTVATIEVSLIITSDNKKLVPELDWMWKLLGDSWNIYN